MGISAGIGVAGLVPGVCTSSTRPANPYEGQIIYETDTDMLAVWNGSAWRYIAASTPTSGSVLQVVESSYTTAVTNSTTTYADTGLTVSITPKSSSSKVLVIANVNGCYKSADNANSYLILRLVRGSTELTQFETGMSYTATALANYAGSSSVAYMDSPATTSSTTYKVQFKNGASATTVGVQVNSSRSSIVVMEVAG